MERVSTNIDIYLSKREKCIARLIAWGYVQKEIADMLKISTQTISVHLRNIYRKLHIHKETDLARVWLFNEYGIADNPFKKVVVILFLVISFAAILTENNLLRVFPGKPLKTASRVISRVKVRRSERVFYMQPALTA